MTNRNDNIKYELAYFYKVIKNMDLKDSKKQIKVKEFETSLDEVIYDKFSVNTDLDKQLSEKTLLGWIELIENPNLYKALKGLTIEDQIFISYIIKERRTHRELSKMYNIAHQNVSKRFNKIINRLRQFMKL